MPLQLYDDRRCLVRIRRLVERPLTVYDYLGRAFGRVRALQSHVDEHVITRLVPPIPSWARQKHDVHTPLAHPVSTKPHRTADASITS
jgi:hypothetical protein